MDIVFKIAKISDSPKSFVKILIASIYGSLEDLVIQITKTFHT